MPGWMHSGMQSHAPMAARPAAPPLHPCRRLARNGSAPFAPATTHCSAGHGGRRAASIVQLQALPGMLAASPLLATLPPSVLTDSYKATHFLQYPDATEMVAVSCWAAVASPPQRQGMLLGPHMCPEPAAWSSGSGMIVRPAGSGPLPSCPQEPLLIPPCSIACALYPRLPPRSMASSGRALAATSLTRGSWCGGCAM